MFRALGNTEIKGGHFVPMFETSGNTEINGRILFQCSEYYSKRKTFVLFMIYWEKYRTFVSIFIILGNNEIKGELFFNV